MFIISCIIGTILASMGVGGGSVFVLLLNIFNICSHKEAMIYNLILFVAVGITATLVNIKNKNFDKKIFIKMVIFSILFSVLGVIASKNLEENNLKTYFNVFILLMGIYEIISSLISIKKAKNNNT